MKSRQGGRILILLGAVIAVLVGVIVFSVTRQATAETKIDVIDVVVATRDIPERTLVPVDAIAIKRLPVDAVPAGAVTKPSLAAEKMTSTKIFSGEMILAGKLADTKGQSGIAYALEKGHVLVTYPASDIVGTGALHVGDTVDILVTYKGPSQNTGATVQTETLPPTTQTTMQNLKIISIGSNAAANKTGAPNAGGNLITFAMDHQDALLLKAIKDGDGLSLEVVLRAAGDDEIVKTQPVTMRTIIERYRLRSP